MILREVAQIKAHNTTGAELRAILQLAPKDMGEPVNTINAPDLS